MPICKRANFEGVQSSKSKNDTFHDNDEVFFCEVTKEIFRDYEDYFRHVMVINSTVWQCEATGRENLTYAEALKSEKRARKKMELFKESLRPPVMLVIEHAKQSSIKLLNALIAKFLRKRYFLKEIVTISTKPSNIEYKVIEILLPDDKQPDNDVVYEETENLNYKLQRVTGNEKETVVVPFVNVRRQKGEFTNDSMNMFVKHNVTREMGILRPKPDSYKKYITDQNITFKTIFIGKMPHYTPAKIKKPPANGIGGAGAGAEPKKQATMNKYLVKKSEETKDAKSKLKAEQKEKERQEKAELKAKTLKEQMERLRLEKLEKIAALERERVEKREKLMQKIEAECDALLNKTDDLQRSDQRLLPIFTPIRSFINNELIGDAFMIREFMHTHRTLLSGIEVFRGSLNFYDMTRAFTMREVVGPLSDILLILLGTIFDLQREEESECNVNYCRVWGNLREREPYKTMSLAALTHFYSKRCFSFKINQLPIDALTLTEVLRLHLLSSGSSVTDRAEKWRIMYRNGYSSIEDPGLQFHRQFPHIMHALNFYPIYELSFIDIIQIIQCLMSQILTYSSTVNLIEERIEQQAKNRNELKNLLWAENRRLANVQNQRRTLTTEHNQQCLNLTENIEEQKRQLENKLSKKVADILSLSERDARKYRQQSEKINIELFDHLSFLGMDRAYRKYYVLESMPGIFIEHIDDSMDICLNEPPINVLPNDLKFNAATLPRNRKELRSYLLKMYKDEEKSTSIKPEQNKPNGVSLDNKENQENHIVNGDLPNGFKENKENTEVSTIKQEIKVTTTTTTTETETETIPITPPTQTDLYMCSGEPENCIVHSKQHKLRQSWTYIYKKEDIETLIDTLNPLGERESNLREQIIALREQIIQHARKCPIELLTLDDPKSKYDRLILTETQRKYNRSNFDLKNSDDMNMVMHFALIERILQFELDIYSGDLGRLKVKDADKWRQDVLNGTYESQTQLQWGFTATELMNGGSGGGGTNETTENSNENNGGEKIDDENIEIARLGNRFRPGEHLKDIELKIKTDGNLTEMQTNVKNLASALLQVEQAIERRFIKEPFGTALKETKDKELQEKKQKEANERMKRWETSLMESTSFSQIFLHLNILNDCIVWSRSTNKSLCQICRRGTNPENMLLCDECNGGTHMFCMKPKMKTVPEGNWYCSRCVKRLGLKNSTGNNKDEKKTKALKRKFIMDDGDNNSETSSVSSTAARGRSKIAKTERGSKRSRKSLQDNEIEEVLAEENGTQADEDDDEEEVEAEEEENDDEEIEDEGMEEEVEDEEVEEEAEAAEEDEIENSADEDDEEQEEDEETSENEETGKKLHNGTVDEAEDDDDVDDSNDEANETAQEDDEEPVCSICSYDGSELSCSRCKNGFHLECVNLRRQPRYTFVCQTCRTKEQAKQKRKTRDSSDDDDDDTEDTEDQEASQPLVKRSRSTRTSLRGSGQYNGKDADRTTEASSQPSASGRRSGRRTGDNLPLNSSAIYKLLDEIMKADSAWPFIRPVSLSEVPDYHKIIKHPMDLAKVKSKLNMGEYRINEEVMNDINLVFKNCDKYNESGNEIYEAGKSLEKMVIKLCKDLHLPYKVSDLNK